MKISEASNKLAIPRFQIDYWRKTGLLSRTEEGLTFDDLLRVRFIWQCKSNGVSLKKIRAALQNLKKMTSLEEGDLGEESSSMAYHKHLSLQLPGHLLQRVGELLFQQDTGQLFFSYNESGGDAGKSNGRLVAFRTTADREDNRRIAELMDLEREYQLAVQEGHDERIKPLLLDLVRLDPEHMGALIELGNIAFEVGDMEEALKRYEAVAAIDPMCVEAHYNLANIYFKQQKYAVAIRYFERCIALDPEFPESYYNLGIVYQSLSYFDQALFYFEEYLRLDEDSFWAQQTRTFIEDIRSILSGRELTEQRPLLL